MNMLKIAFVRTTDSAL